jgi:hypothetical protein
MTLLDSQELPSNEHHSWALTAMDTGQCQDIFDRHPICIAGTRLGGRSLLGDREGIFGHIEGGGGCLELLGVTGEGGGCMWMRLGEGRLPEDRESTCLGASCTGC